MRATGYVLVIVCLGLADPANADVFKVFGEVHGGVMAGQGRSGDQKDEAFFANAPNGMYGVRVGARFLILEAAIQHHQFRNGDRVATWTQFAAGIGFEAGLGSTKQNKAKTGTFFDVGANVAFGLGTGQQVDPPLSNDEVTDKGFLLEGRIGFGKHLNKLLDVGIALPVSWGYFFKNGAGNDANDVSNQYQGLQLEVVAYLRLNIKLL